MPAMSSKIFCPPEINLKGQIAIKDRDYHSIAEIVYQQTGINLGEGKRLMVQSRLNRRLHELDLGTFEDYVAYLKSDKREDELQEFINSLTTNKTNFFREIEHFNFLRRTFLEGIIKKLAEENKTYYFWSAACSSGEEVYTIAMLLDEFKNEHPLFEYRILGSDIDTSVLDKAQRGIYSKDQMNDVGPNYFQKYFKRIASEKGTNYKISNGLLKNIKFRQVNLIDKNQFLPIKFDVIFLRNVLIYFDRPTIQKVISFLESHLNKDGYLFVGHSETLNGIHHKMKSLGGAIYKKM